MRSKLLALSLVLVAACVPVTAGETAGKACVTTDVTAAIGSGSTETIIAAVTGILIAGALDWRAELAKLALQIGDCGVAAVNAAVTAAVDSLAARVAAVPSASAAAASVSVDTAAIARGRAYLTGAAL